MEVPAPIEVETEDQLLLKELYILLHSSSFSTNEPEVRVPVAHLRRAQCLAKRLVHRPLRDPQMGHPITHPFLQFSNEIWAMIIDMLAEEDPQVGHPITHPFLQFPNEIWALIIDLSAEEPRHRGTFGLELTSRDAVTSLCLVDRAYNRIMTPFLYSSVWIQSYEQLKQFHAAITRPGSILGSFVEALAIEFGYTLVNGYCGHMLRDMLPQMSRSLWRFHFDEPLSLVPCHCVETGLVDDDADTGSKRNLYKVLDFPRLEEFRIRTHSEAAVLRRSYWEQWKSLRVLRLHTLRLDLSFVRSLMGLSALTDLTLMTPLTNSADSLEALGQLLTEEHPSLQHIVVDSIIPVDDRRWFTITVEASEVAGGSYTEEREERLAGDDSDSDSDSGVSDISADSKQQDNHPKPGDPLHWGVLAGDFIPDSREHNYRSTEPESDTDSEISYDQRTEDMEAEDALDTSTRTQSLADAILALPSGIRKHLSLLFRLVEEYEWVDCPPVAPIEFGERKRPEWEEEAKSQRAKFAQLCTVDWEAIKRDGVPGKCVLFEGCSRTDSSEPTPKWPNRRGGW